MYPEPSTAQKALEQANSGSAKALKLVRKGAKRALTWDEVFAGMEGAHTSTGVRVNEEKSLQMVAVYACVSYIADYVASLPRIVYERLSKGKKRAQTHWLYNLVHDQPNPYMNDYEFVETLTGHVLLWGNAFAEIVRDNSGRVIELWPLRPDRMRIQLFNSKLFYYYATPDGTEQQLTQEQVFHLRGLGSDGIVGYSPIQLHREAIGLAFAEQEWRSRFFSNGANFSGVLQHPGQMSKEAVERLRKQWEQKHSGLSNAHRLAVLEEGATWQQIGPPAKDMEFIEGRKYQKNEIATIYRVKPYKIGILEPGTVSFASIEQQALDTHIDTMRPWVLRWEKRLSHLLSGPERLKFFVEFLFDALLRADSESRARTLQIWRMNGLINADDWLELENRNPLPNNQGKDYWRPTNMAVVGEEEEEPMLTGVSNGNGAPAPDRLNGSAGHS